MSLIDNTDPHKGYVSNLKKSFTGSGLVVEGPIVENETVSVKIPSIHEASVFETSIDVYTNRYLELQHTFESFGGPSIVKEMEELKKKLQSIANNEVQPSEQAIFYTSKGEVIFSERKSKRTICNMAKLLQKLIGKLGIEKLAEIVTIPLGTVDKIFGPEEIEDCIEVDYGPRTLVSAKEKP